MEAGAAFYVGFILSYCGSRKRLNHAHRTVLRQIARCPTRPYPKTLTPGVMYTGSRSFDSLPGRDQTLCACTDRKWQS